MSIAGRRIALFTGNYNHIADGVSLTLNRLVGYLIEKGAKVKIFAPTIEPPAFEHQGELVAVKSIAAPGRPEYRVALGLSSEAKDQLEKFDPELVHIATPDLLGRAALKWAKKSRLPVLATYHTHFASYLDYYKLGILESALWRNLKKFYDQCDATYVPSQSMIDVLELHGLTNNLGVWARGLEQDRFGPEKRSSTFRSSRDIKEDEIVVCFVSRLVWEKGLAVFRDVILNLEKEGVAHRSLIVGDGPAMEELQTSLSNTLFTGKLFGEDLPEAYASADIFLFPSESETFGNVTLEAMASGLACVVADATGSKSLVDNEVTGFLAKPRDTDQFFDLTKRLIQDRELREDVSTRAEEASKAYSWESILGQMKNNYLGLLGDR